MEPVRIKVTNKLNQKLHYKTTFEDSKSITYRYTTFYIKLSTKTKNHLT